MAFDAHKNLAIATVSTAPGMAGLSLTVASGEGALFPVAPFNATVWPANAAALPTNAEIVRVTARAGDVLTIARAQEGTTAKPIAVGYLIANTATAKTFTDIEAIGTGTWKAEPFNAAHYTALSPMIWTVGSPAAFLNRYTVIGKVLHWAVYVSWFSGSNVLSGSPSNRILIKLPGGLSGPGSQFGAVALSQGVAGVAGVAGLFAEVVGGQISIGKSDFGSYALTDTPGVASHFTFEIA